MERRYNSIRTNFGRYRKSIEAATGSGRDSVVLRDEFEHLRWLIPHIRQRKTTNYPGNTQSQSQPGDGDLEEGQKAEEPADEPADDIPPEGNRIYHNLLLYSSFSIFISAYLLFV